MLFSPFDSMKGFSDCINMKKFSTVKLLLHLVLVRSSLESDWPSPLTFEQDINDLNRVP